jgi:phosphatidylglycerophosphatase A
MSRLIATFFYSGLLPGAPGTWGSLAALPCAWALHWAGGFPLLLLATLALFPLGLWAAGAEALASAEHDPGHVVVDEVVGQWIALFPLSFGLWHAGAAPATFPWPGWVLGFLAFRLFDVWKPWPVSVADRGTSPFTLMLDDVLAGLMAGLVVLAAGLAWHRFLT